MFHSGFVVKNLETENHFYRGRSRLPLYWHGGFNDEVSDWYEIQVPDGDNWIEFMLNIPANADHQGTRRAKPFFVRRYGHSQGCGPTSQERAFEI